MDRNVEYILEVARCGGITRAAENLFITPSALSKYVIALEDQLQVKLFHRIGKSFVPTKAGEYYIRRCMEIEQIYQEMGDGEYRLHQPQNPAVRRSAKSCRACSAICTA